MTLNSPKAEKYRPAEFVRSARNKNFRCLVVIRGKFQLPREDRPARKSDSWRIGSQTRPSREISNRNVPGKNSGKSGLALR